MSQPVDYRSRMQQISGALATAQVQIEQGAVRGFDMQQAIRIYTSAISRNEKLLLCTHESLRRCIMDAGSLGLYIGSTLGQCYAVPFRNKNLRPPLDHEATFLLGYQGMCELVRRTGEVQSINAEIVYEHDHFVHKKGLHPVLDHVPYGYDEQDRQLLVDGKLDRGKPILGYCIAVFKDGGHHVETLTIDQIQKRRQRSRARDDGPWVTDWYPMARKTMVRAAFPFLPKTPAIYKAMALDDQVELPDVSRTLINVPVDLAEEPRSRTDELTQAVKDRQKSSEPEKPSEPAKEVKPRGRKRATTKRSEAKPTQEPPKQESAPAGAAGAQREIPAHVMPDDNPEKEIPATAAEVDVDVDSARDACDKQLSKLGRAQQNILAHRFKKKYGTDWTSAIEVEALTWFYEEIDEVRQILGGES